MKKLFNLNSIYWKTAIIAIMANVHIASGQKEKEKTVPIPEDINKIFLHSCMPCHGAKGGRFPTARLNFSRWKGYGPSKEADKASLICSALRKGAMPPKSARESKPELIPTKEQIDLICKWAESVRPPKGKK